MTEKLKIDLTDRRPVLVSTEEWPIVVYESARSEWDSEDPFAEFEVGAVWARKHKSGWAIAGVTYEIRKELRTQNIEKPLAFYRKAELFATFDGDEEETFKYLSRQLIEDMVLEEFEGIKKARKFLRSLRDKALASMEPEEIQPHE